MPHDWHTRYGYRPLLLETLVDTERFRGACYRAHPVAGRSPGRQRYGDLI